MSCSTKLRMGEGVTRGQPALTASKHQTTRLQSTACAPSQLRGRLLLYPSSRKQSSRCYTVPSPFPSKRVPRWIGLLSVKRKTFWCQGRSSCSFTRRTTSCPSFGPS
jgi:hypothetical protein